MKRWANGTVVAEPLPRERRFTYAEMLHADGLTGTPTKCSFSVTVSEGEGEFYVRALRALTGEVERAMEAGLV